MNDMRSISEVQVNFVSVCKKLNEYYKIIKDLKTQRNEYVDKNMLAIFDELIVKIDGIMQEYLQQINEHLKER